jgi:hypothetical protein
MCKFGTSILLNFNRTFLNLLSLIMKSGIFNLRNLSLWSLNLTLLALYCLILRIRDHRYSHIRVLKLLLKHGWHPIITIDFLEWLLFNEILKRIGDSPQVLWLLKRNLRYPVVSIHGKQIIVVARLFHLQDIDLILTWSWLLFNIDFPWVCLSCLNWLTEESCDLVYILQMSLRSLARLVFGTCLTGHSWDFTAIYLVFATLLILFIWGSCCRTCGSCHYFRWCF